MNRKLKTIISAFAVSALAFTAFAQDVPASQAAKDTAEYARMFQARNKLMLEVAPARDLYGMPVENYKDEKLGKVDSIYVNLKSGRIVQVVLATPGGFRNRLTAVPPGALHNDDAGLKILRLNVSREKFAAAPRFDTGMNNAVDESNLVSSVYAYYNQQTYFVADPEGVWTTNMDGTINTDGDRNLNKSHNADIDRHVGAASNTIATRNPNGSQNRNYYSTQNAAIASFSDLGNVRKVRSLLGMTVRNLQGEKLGKVDDFLLDLSAGRIAGTIIVTGRILGSGGTYSAAPSTALRYDPARNDLKLDATPDQLEDSPDFDIAGWPNYRLPGNYAGNYYPYVIQPYNNYDSGVTNSSAKSVRASDSASLPVLKQGKNMGDEDITAAIRREITDDQGLSVNAKNVLIITTGGRVTLRGPVNNGDEKHNIGVIAMRNTPSQNVDNEIQVQLTTTTSH